MDPRLEERTLAAEDGHWWYLGRRGIVADAARRLAAPGARTLDAGCGGGAMLVELGSLGEVVGLEPSPTSRARAEARGAGEVVDGSLLALPFPAASFDLALALDVLEHIDDDRAALIELGRVVRPGGGLVVTVPAHPRLWGRHDELNHHFRRYTRASLREVAEEAGWRVERLTHFNALLLPLAAAARRFGGGDGLEIPPPALNRGLRRTLELERRAIARGRSFAAGLSLLAELRR